MSKEKVNAYLIKVDKKSKKTQVGEWILIIQDNVIHTGTWMTSVEDYIQGILTGLELANVNVNTETIEIYDDEEYERVASGDINLERLAKMAGLI